MNPRLKVISTQMHNVHYGQNWFGQSYQIKLRDLDPEQYFIRPYPEVHSVAELIAHGTAWRTDVILKIKTGKGELTEANEADWPEINSLQKKGWEKIHRDYTESVDGLIQLLNDKDDSLLDTMYHDPEFDGEFPYSFTIYGILQHDLYHLGQLGIVIRMLRG